MSTLNELWVQAAAAMGVDVSDTTLNETIILALQAIIAGGGAYAPLNSPHFTGAPLAPTATSGTNTTQLATTAFVQTAVAGASSADDFAVNSFINGDSAIQQTGPGPFVAITGGTVYAMDGLFLEAVDAVTTSIMGPATISPTGGGWPEGLENVDQWTFDTTNVASTGAAIDYIIENAAALGTAQSTFSLYAQAQSGTLTLTRTQVQNFGTGGSPSSPLSTAIPGTIVATGTPTRFSGTWTPPSISGKTLGTDSPPTHYTTIRLSVPQGVSGSVFLGGKRINRGASAAPFVLGDRTQDDRRCRRFIDTFDYGLFVPLGASAATQQYKSTVPLRATPSDITVITAPTIAGTVSAQAWSNLTVRGWIYVISGNNGETSGGLGAADVRIPV